MSTPLSYHNSPLPYLKANISVGAFMLVSILIIALNSLESELKFINLISPYAAFTYVLVKAFTF